MTTPEAASAAATDKVAEPAKKAPAKRARETAASVTEIGSKAKTPAPKLPYSAMTQNCS